MANIESPIPLSDIEAVLAWVDSFKLSRSNKKINRDFSDAVLLAEILSQHYPKLVEMHNYPPRNSHALKLNNWMTLNRKVLRKLKLNLCCGTMEQLANCTPGVIERVLVMVRDKIHRDEEMNKSMRDAEQNMSSGGSYYEACGDDEHILVVPVKTRVNGILETVQQKVVSYESYQGVKEELKDAKETTELLKQKVEHFDSLLQLKDERIEELQRQLERKQARRKEAEALQNCLAVPFETVPPPVITEVAPNKSAQQIAEGHTKIIEPQVSKIIEPHVSEIIEPHVSKIIEPHVSKIIEPHVSKIIEPHVSKIIEPHVSKIIEPHVSETKVIVEPKAIVDFKASFDSRISAEESKIPRPMLSRPSITEVSSHEVKMKDLEIIKSDVFKEIDSVDKTESSVDVEDFKDSEEAVVTIEDTINAEIKNISSDN